MATIDSRIAMGVQPLDVGASIGRGYQLRDLAAQSDARAMDAQLKQQAVQKQRTLGDLYRTATTDGKLDRSAFSQGVADAGYGADLPAIQKGWTDQDKAHAEYLSKNSDRIIKQMDYIGRTAASLLANPNTTTDDAIRAVSGLTQFGLLSPEDGAQIARTVPGDPDQLRQWLQQQAITAQSNKDALEVILPKVQAQNLGGRTVMVDMNPMTNPAVVGQSMERTATPGEVEQQRHNRASEGLTARGQNLADSRAREANANNLSRPFEVTGEDGKPVLVQQDKQGNIRPVTGYQPKSGADKALTEGQAKAMLFGSRMDASNKILDSLADAKVTTSIPGSRAGFGVGSVVNALSSSKQQQLDQAKRDFINATLRRESGAAIAESEFNNAEKQYFPQVGDSKEVIKQKAENRALATRAMLAEVPESKRHVVDDVINGGTGSPARKPNADQKSKVVNFSDLK